MRAPECDQVSVAPCASRQLQVEVQEEAKHVRSRANSDGRRSAAVVAALGRDLPILRMSASSVKSTAAFRKC